ncbi:MAG: hypothetical protein Q8K82_13570 [Gemmatimonadaceae bacterium]|nr:hypothetical protein [Gemmatimonadaceae bacterium]
MTYLILVFVLAAIAFVVLLRSGTTMEWISPVTGRVVCLHFNNRLARLGGGVNNCMTLGPNDILISRDWIGSKTLSHEDGHTITAKIRGVLYLPWVLCGYISKGIAKAKAELEADHNMKNAHLYHAIGTVPSWAGNA